MEKVFAMEIVTPMGLAYKSEVTHVKLPGVEGYFGVLAGHEPFITSLKLGEIKADLPGGETKYFAVTGGLVEVLPEKVSILVESAEEAHEIDLEGAQKEKENLEKRILTLPDKKEIEKAKKALEKAVIRIRVAQKLKAKNN